MPHLMKHYPEEIFVPLLKKVKNISEQPYEIKRAIFQGSLYEYIEEENYIEKITSLELRKIMAEHYSAKKDLKNLLKLLENCDMSMKIKIFPKLPPLTA